MSFVFRSHNLLERNESLLFTTSFFKLHTIQVEHEGVASGIGIGIVLLVVFGSYAMAVWFGAKMILKKGYNGGDVINIIVAMLTGSMDNW